ncbi:MAG TPA: hypothetical protein VMW50_02920, partial [Dehalococcoidia bacterium]|nr:hypothetical protein [Dehalococcoidia bacterium]
IKKRGRDTMSRTVKIEDCKKVNCWALRELKWGVLCIAKECIHPEAHTSEESIKNGGDRT